jgi:hypothetical protein
LYNCFEEYEMTEHPVTLAVSDYVYNRARKIAEATSQPVEQVLARQLEESFSDLAVLPSDEQAELAALKYLSDDTLRAMAREQMPHSRQERMHSLLDRNSTGTITPDEQQELSQLVDQGDRLMLRKAWAADILMDRGYKITAKDMTVEDE